MNPTPLDLFDKKPAYRPTIWDRLFHALIAAPWVWWIGRVVIIDGCLVFMRPIPAVIYIIVLVVTLHLWVYRKYTHE